MRHANLHAHTLYSDGKSSQEEMLKAAIACGFVSMGVSDHSETPCDFSYCARASQYPSYCQEARELKEKYSDRIEYFCGLEKDAFSQVDPEMFDYLIGSVHYVFWDGEYTPVDLSRDCQEKLISKHGRGEKLELAKRYYDTVVSHAQKSQFPIQGHFDLISKFGLFDDAGERYQAIALEALDEVLKIVPYFEVNTGLIYRGYRNVQNPEDFLLRRILEKGGKVLLSSDAHCPEGLAFGFDDMVEKLRDLGFSSIWQLRRLGFQEVPL